MAWKAGVLKPSTQQVWEVQGLPSPRRLGPDTTHGCSKDHGSRLVSSPMLWKAEGPRDG